ncbi:hypothetical protein EC968_006045 [Mortierella alpina]|nr:hypothetical protein EC968_006045 [Mortierella alpina]
MAIRLLPVVTKLVWRPAKSQIEQAAESVAKTGLDNDEMMIARDILLSDGLQGSEPERPEDKFNYYVASLMRMYSSAAYDSSSHDASCEDKETSLHKMSSDDLEVDTVESLFDKTRSDGSSGPRGNLIDFGVSVVAFKGTTITCRDEVLTDVNIKLHSNDNEKCNDQCRKICYRHGENCDRCALGCDTHAKYLDGGVHQGFYDLLFKATHAPPKDHRYLTEGPVNAMTVILEKILYQTLDHDEGRWQTSLWLTGHSLGGALASLVMARLQTPVDRDDPLVRGLDPDTQQFFIGCPVLYVMTAQAINNFPAAYACESCEEEGCKDKDWKNCTRCSYCRMMRSKIRRRMDWVDKRRHCCIRLWVDRVSNACEACVDFMDDEENTFKKHVCVKESEERKCFCGNCGNCSYCDKLKNCTLCNPGLRNWPVVLRGCYTFGSPKVGDEKFAETFDENQKKAFWRIEEDKNKADDRDERRRIADEENYRSKHYAGWSAEDIAKDRMEDIKERYRSYWPVYWRIVNEGDPVTQMPYTFYRHVGYRVQLPSDNRFSPIILHSATRSKSTPVIEQEEAMIKGAIRSPNELTRPRHRKWSSLFMLWLIADHNILVYDSRLTHAREFFASYDATRCNVIADGPEEREE